VERFESAVSLQEILYLVFVVLFGEAADEELSRPIINLRRNDPKCDCVNNGHGTARLDLGILLELRWASDAQVHILKADAIQLDSS
jgi:hypothetical protein